MCCFCHVLNVLSTRWQYSSVYRLAGRLFPCRWLDKKKFMMQSFSKLPKIAKWSNNFQLYLYYHISAFHRVIYYLHFYGHGLMDLLCQPLKNKEERYCKSAHMSESTLASSRFISCFLVFRPVFCKSTAFWEMQRYIKHKTKCHTGLKRGSEACVSGGTCMCLTCEGKHLQRHYWLNSGLTLK